MKDCITACKSALQHFSVSHQKPNQSMKFGLTANSACSLWVLLTMSRSCCRVSGRPADSRYSLAAASLGVTTATLRGSTVPRADMSNTRETLEPRLHRKDGREETKTAFVKNGRADHANEFPSFLHFYCTSLVCWLSFSLGWSILRFFLTQRKTKTGWKIFLFTLFYNSSDLTSALTKNSVWSDKLLLS